MLWIVSPNTSPMNVPAGIPVKNLVTLVLSYGVRSWTVASIPSGAMQRIPRSQEKTAGLLPRSSLPLSLAGSIRTIALLTDRCGFTTAASTSPKVTKRNREASREHTGISFPLR